ncbi:conserved hypothetical protein [Candidatus Roizmanbacteria bacterium]|nr:conserved hypothetical protein [Candidatus Roizmanbacteria bacterium]
MKDKEHTDIDEVFESRDKQVIPFLLTQQEVKFVGTRLEGSILYFQFTPLSQARQLVNAFVSRRAPLVQPKDLLDAVETFRDIIFEMKEKRRNYV